MYFKILKTIFLFVCLFFLGIPVVYSQEFIAPDFKVLDSTMNAGGYGSSADFRLFGIISGMSLGISNSGSYGVKSGPLYYPEVIAPVLTSATPGDAQVTLTWTAAQAFQGWSIGGYNICYKTTGAYTCTDVGLVTTTSKTGLSNGTEYTFEIEAYDAYDNIIAVSNELSATPVTPPTPTPTPPPSGGGGGGGGGYIPSGTGTVLIRGIAYANATVTVYIDGAIVSSVRAGSGARFDITLTNVAAGLRTIGLVSEDVNGRKSITSTFPLVLTSGSTMTLTDVFLAPTIDISSYQVGVGEPVRIFGQTAPSSAVNVHVESQEIITPTVANSDGSYAILFDTKQLDSDTHTTKSRATFSQVVSPFSHVLQFIVGKGAGVCNKRGDLNFNCRVDIVDFSILLFWWNTKQQKGLDISDINQDGRVSIVDFSIMMYNWTG